MRLTKFPRKRGLLTALLVIVGLVATVAVARAATPAITGSTTPPAGHFSGECSGCHAVDLKLPEIPGPATLDPHHSRETSEAVDPSDKAREAGEVDDQGEQDGHPDAVSHGDAPSDEHAGDQNGQGENGPSAHETVAPRTQERTHHDLHSSDQGDQDDRSSDQGGASQHDGGGASSGGSD